MSNAAKYKKKAAEFEQLKQVDRAIASYVKAIEESEAAGEDIDVVLFNKVGDLALRQGRVPDAITYYERAVEHYATSGLFNNAIALCNKILRNAPGRANVYFTLGRICGRKGLRGDATRNFLEYATRMQQEGRVEEGMRALAEVADLMPELTEVQALVEEHAARAGIALPRRRTPIRPSDAVPVSTDAQGQRPPMRDERSADLVFLDVDYGDPRSRTPMGNRRVPTPRGGPSVEATRAVAPTTTENGSLGAAPALPFLDVPERIEGLVDVPAELGGAVSDVSELEIAPEPSVIRLTEIDAADVSAIDGLEAAAAVSGSDAELLEGFTSDAAADDALVPDTVTPPSDVTWLVPPDAEEAVQPLDDVMLEDITDPLGERGLQAVILTETPMGVPAIPDIPKSASVSTGLEFVDDLPPVAAGEPDADRDAIEMDPVALEFLEIEPTDAGILELESFDLPLLEPDEQNTSADGIAGVSAMEGFEGLDATSFEFDVFEMASSDTSALIEPLDVTDVPELDAAIAAGVELVAQAEAAETHDDAADHPDHAERVSELQDVRDIAPLDRTGRHSVIPQASFRIDPHDFVQSGELPPLLLSDAQVDRGLRVALATPAGGMASIAVSPMDTSLVVVTPVSTPAVSTTPVMAVPAVAADELLDLDEPDADIEAAADMLRQSLESPVTEGISVSLVSPTSDVDLLDLDEVELGEAETPPMGDSGAPEALVGPHEADSEPVDVADVEPRDATEQASDPLATTIADSAPTPAQGGEEIADSEDTPDQDIGASEPRPIEVVHATPSLPMAAVAAEAVGVATSRRDALRAAVARLPQNWLLRRRLAESLFEAGERDAALHELETAQQGLVNEAEYQAAAEIADELVHVAPDCVPYHQKRVELAVRLQAQDRLQLTYLDLADALVRMGEEARARAVYARVLELDPYDDRARAALGAAAPPPPPPPRPDDQFVDLADWLRDDDGPASTRMRMREPVISGDEQADFNALLQHFKDGVSRSLGENDFEGHYDLGVAYKEMGLLDDAIAEFQKALRSRAHRLPAYEALGQCFVEQGRHQIAATVLSRALHEPGLDDDQRVGVLYLLAYSCEALQRTDEARSYFQRVYATDINFRDVAARLAALDQAKR
jgi:tetratricopeptide (TPR) repeat protein